MQLFKDYEDEHGVVIRPGWILNDVSLTITRKRRLITYRSDLAQPIALRAVVTMIEVLRLAWEGTRFRFRYPLPDDDRELAEATARNRRDYRHAERLAIRRLVPDALIAQADREEWEPWQLAEACGLDELTCARRVREWRASRERVVSIAAFAWDGPIPF
jgi:hypothetical protein